jgi:hypothetical protein
LATYELRWYLWKVAGTAEQYIALLDTFSSDIVLPAADRERLCGRIRDDIAARPTNRVDRHWYSILHVARAQ